MSASVFLDKDLDVPAPLLPYGDEFKQLLKNVVDGVSPGSFTATMDNATYHAQKAFISNSGMKELLRSPAHYFEYLNGEREEKAPNLGTAIHAAVLEPAEFAKHYVTYAGYRRGKAWDEFQAANPDKQILNETESAAVEGVVKAVAQFDAYPLRAALDIGEVEKSIFWIDEETGVGCRIRADCLTPFVIFDVKSIDDARPEKVARQVASMEYDLQAFMYTEGVRAFTGKTLPFYFVFIETGRPHGIWIHRAGQSVMRNGEIKFRRGVRAFKRLQATGDWHGYANPISDLELPRYSLISPTAEDGIDLGQS